MSDLREQTRDGLIGAALLTTLLVASAGGSFLGAVWSRELRATLVDTGLSLALALPLGSVLGFLAGSGTKIVETTLGRAVEISAAMPTVLLAAALLDVSGRFYLAALALGLLRGLEVAWLLRGHLTAVRERLHLDAQSKVRLPLAVYYRRVLPLALGPALASVALTPAWLSALDAAGALARLHPLSARLSLGGAAARGELWAFFTIAVLTLGLFLVARYFGGRFQADEDEHHHEPLPLAMRRRTSQPHSESGL